MSRGGDHGQGGKGGSIVGVSEAVFMVAFMGEARLVLVLMMVQALWEWLCGASGDGAGGLRDG